MSFSCSLECRHPKLVLGSDLWTSSASTGLLVSIARGFLPAFWTSFTRHLHGVFFLPPGYCCVPIKEERSLMDGKEAALITTSSYLLNVSCKRCRGTDNDRGGNVESLMEKD
jgi:hypothetical protein